LKKLVVSVCLAATAFMVPALAQTSVGVSVGINQPGLYGRIDIGNYPQPVVINSQPVVIVQPAVVVQRQPIYLYVPPGHQKKWGKHCYKYNACGQPVYFVKEQWVQERYQQEHPHWKGERHASKHGGRDRGDDDHGKGHGKGHGHGKSRD
jgi:hypothetical protein